MPSSVMMAEVAGGTLNSSAANLRTAVKGVASGTLNTLNGSFGSDVNVILNVTLAIFRNRLSNARRNFKLIVGDFVEAESEIARAKKRFYVSRFPFSEVCP